MDITVEGTHAYAIGNHRLYVLDVSQPGEPRPISTLEGLGRLRQIVVESGIAYITSREDGLFIVDVSDSNLKKEFLARTKFHMLHAGSSQGGAYYFRHLKDAAPNQMWKHDPSSDKDKIRVAYQHQIHKYTRCVMGNDDNLKRVLDYHDAEKLTDNTIVIYTSDQGYWLGQHGCNRSRLVRRPQHLQL